jgi:hypothetical protein
MGWCLEWSGAGIALRAVPKLCCHLENSGAWEMCTDIGARLKWTVNVTIQGMFSNLTSVVRHFRRACGLSVSLGMLYDKRAHRKWHPVVLIKL